MAQRPTLNWRIGKAQVVVNGLQLRSSCSLGDGGARGQCSRNGSGSGFSWASHLSQHRPGQEGGDASCAIPHVYPHAEPGNCCALGVSVCVCVRWGVLCVGPRAGASLTHAKPMFLNATTLFIVAVTQTARRK